MSQPLVSSLSGRGIPRWSVLSRFPWPSVQPAARSQGIAGMLLDALHDYARNAGYRWLYLDSKDDLVIARRFYETHGYSHCDRYTDNPQATVFMRTQLY